MVAMPAPDTSVLSRREAIVAALRAIVPGEGVIANDVAMRPYESDGLTAYRQLPMVVVLPETTAQVSKVLSYCYENGVKVVPRGAGTSLSGGALPVCGGISLSMEKFTKVRKVDTGNLVMEVESGVTTAEVHRAAEEAGAHKAMQADPSTAASRNVSREHLARSCLIMRFVLLR